MELMHKEYLRRVKQLGCVSLSQDEADQKDNVDVPGLPAMSDASENDAMRYYCDGSCHDGGDAIGSMRTSLGQFVLFLQMTQRSGGCCAYRRIKQLWYDTMFRRSAELLSHDDVLNEGTFDALLAQVIQDEHISRVVLRTFEALRSSPFISAMQKYKVCRGIKQFASEGRHEVKTRHIVAFLAELVENVERVFEAKLLFSALLDALCKGRQQCQFAAGGDAEKRNAYFTSEELQLLESHLGGFDYAAGRCSCAETYALRCLLAAVVRVSTERKHELFSSAGGQQSQTRNHVFAAQWRRRARNIPRYRAHDAIHDVAVSRPQGLSAVAPAIARLVLCHALCGSE